MKTLNLAAVVSSVLLLVAGAAHAEGAYKTNGYNHNFMAKRPYQATVENSAQQKDAQWEGATLIKDQAQTDENTLSNRNVLRVNMLGKRPY